MTDRRSPFTGRGQITLRRKEMRNVSTPKRPTMPLAMSIAFAISILCCSSYVHAATITVTGSGDAVAADGQCTLREAITAANTDALLNECSAGSGADDIDFDAAGVFALPTTITLTGGELLINGDLTIH